MGNAPRPRRPPSPGTWLAEGTLATVFLELTASAWQEKKKKIKRADPRILEKAMATHSSTLAWKIPWTEEPGRLQYTGSLGVGHE